MNHNFRINTISCLLKIDAFGLYNHKCRQIIEKLIPWWNPFVDKKVVLNLNILEMDLDYQNWNISLDYSGLILCKVKKIATTFISLYICAACISAALAQSDLKYWNILLVKIKRWEVYLWAEKQGHSSGMRF